ncbi:hypothetical protein Csa_000684 [Cucumis sativus]|uniref:Uncharacterized protein n=1 Tax=Cucumis sativus TaxID=3659 RepID=A0A0A0KQ36_CUCSA|nr:hypothetical protein Csa_000684 [Cucumis sativus]
MTYTKVEYHCRIGGFHRHVVHVETNARWRSAPKSKQLKMEDNMRNGISEYSNAKCWCQINGFPNESRVQFTTTKENTNDSAFLILLRLNSKEKGPARSLGNLCSSSTYSHQETQCLFVETLMVPALINEWF